MCNSYDVVGDIAIVRLTEKSRKHSEKVAEAIMAVHKNVKTVLAQASAVARARGEGGWVHYYDFEHAAEDGDAVEKVRVKVSEKLLDICASFEIPFGRVVRATGPNWYQIVLDIKAKPGHVYLARLRTFPASCFDPSNTLAPS